MIYPKTLFLILYSIEAAAMIGLSIPLIRRRVVPNSWYGFRVKRTLADPSVWYAANRYAAFHIAALGSLLLVTAIILYAASGVSFVAYALACLGVTLVGLLISVVRSFRFLNQIRG